MKRLITLSLMVALLASACSEPADVNSDDNKFNGAGLLAIQVAATNYSWSDNAFSDVRTITATVIHISDVIYYALLGDALNRGIDQETLYVADGSDGYLEVKEDGEWNSVTRVVLTEGVGIVALRPDGVYNLQVILPGTDQPTGTFRIRLTYSTLTDGSGGEINSDFSDAFIIE